MRRRAVMALLLLLTAAAVGFADDWFVGKPIRDITFKGLRTVSVNELNTIVQPFRGRIFSEQVFWDLQSRLYALDYFETIIPNALPGDAERTSVVIEFTVEERPSVADVRFSGHSAVRTGELLEVVLIKRGDILNESKISVDEEAIRQLYLSRGFPDATVEGAVAHDESGERRVVTFTIAEGYQTTVRRILFSGNTFASEGTLKGVLATKEQGLFNPGVFQEARLEEDRRLVERYYRERGFIDAAVLDIRREIEKDEENRRTYVTLTFFLNEGNQYTYGGMSFEGNELFSTERLRELVRKQPGGLVNLSRVEADFQRVANLYYENGYIFNSITRHEVRDERARTVSYIVRIVERGRARIENIIIKGNEKTRDFVLYRELPLEVGDVFSKTRIMEGLRNLYNLGYFSAVTPETPQGSAEGLMDLVINVEETNTADIRFGLAFGGSADFPVSAQIRWSDSNFMGVGQIMGVELNASPVLQSLSFNFTERWLFGRRWSGSVDFTVRHALTSGIPQDMLFPIFDGQNPGVDAFPDPFTGEYVYSSDGRPFGRQPTDEEIRDHGLVTDYEYAGGTTSIVPSQYRMTYDTYDFSLGLSSGYRWSTPYGTFGIGGGPRTTLTYIDYDPNLYRPYLRTDRDNRGVWLFTNSLSLNMSLDRRDFHFSPSSGYLLRQDIRYVGGLLQGNKHFIRTDTRAEAFVTLLDLPVTQDWNYKLVFGAHSSLSLIHPQFWVPEGFSPITAGTSDRLFIDGMYVARGWPRELDKRAIWNNWAELRMPISERFVWFDMFFDAVGRWNDPEDMRELRLQDFLFGFGAGLRFTLPQFPIRIYLARRFNFDEAGNLNWQTGPIFRETAGLDFVFSIGYELFHQ